MWKTCTRVWREELKKTLINKNVCYIYGLEDSTLRTVNFPQTDLQIPYNSNQNPSRLFVENDKL